MIMIWINLDKSHKLGTQESGHKKSDGHSQSDEQYLRVGQMKWNGFLAEVGLKTGQSRGARGYSYSYNPIDGG